MMIPLRVGCPIRISTDQRLLAAPRGFSQRATSFIASWCQGIHRMPFSYSFSGSLPQEKSAPCTETILREPEDDLRLTHNASEPSSPTGGASVAGGTVSHATPQQPSRSDNPAERRDRHQP